MNTIDNSFAQTGADGDSDAPNQANKRPISGFDPSSRPIWTDPSIYLSICVALAISLVGLHRSPLVFWLSFAGLSIATILFHICAERFVLYKKVQTQLFTAPVDGLFNLLFGAILPGVALLGYCTYTMLTTPNANVILELGKVALILSVPIFNFSVWNAMRKGYIMRPRLVGLMSGLAVGLSASWSLIWFNCIVHSTTECKFGWMLLLCTSPFMLVSASCMCLDLWKKTETRIRETTSTFSLLGGILSLLFVFTPYASALSFQALLNEARGGTGEKLCAAIATLRAVAPPEQLRSSPDRVNGFNLAELLVPNHTLHADSQVDNDVYFRITGEQLNIPPEASKQKTDEATNTMYPQFVNLIDGLALAKSNIDGVIHPETLSATVNWTFTLHNSSTRPAEAMAQIKIPEGAVVSDATLWMNGKPRKAAFGPLSSTRTAFLSVVDRNRDPLLVSQDGNGHTVFDCFPVPANSGWMTARLSFTVPLATKDGRICEMRLPELLKTNFAQPKRHRVELVSTRPLLSETAGLAETTKNGRFVLNGIMHGGGTKSPVLRYSGNVSADSVEVAAHSERGSNDSITFAIQREHVTKPTKVFVVIDTSASLRNRVTELKQAVAALSQSARPTIYLVPNDSSKAKPTKPADITDSKFVGGTNDEPTLREVIELAAEQPNNAVLWIHGAQPIAQPGRAELLDLVHSVRLYDVSLSGEPDTTLARIKASDAATMLAHVPVSVGTSITKSVSDLVSRWQTGLGELRGIRIMHHGEHNKITEKDPFITTELTKLWAADESRRLLLSGRLDAATKAATEYGVVTPSVGAIVLENDKDYKEYHIDPLGYAGMGSINETYRGMHQWFNDDFAGNLTSQVLQLASKEVGQLTDYGYDTARDICKMITLATILLSILLAVLFVRNQKPLRAGAVFKACGLVLFVPLAVHLLGTFLVNNFGGLGGGL
jgi:hypothetical protein